MKKIGNYMLTWHGWERWFTLREHTLWQSFGVGGRAYSRVCGSAKWRRIVKAKREERARHVANVC